jgi:hypothetical protein
MGLGTSARKAKDADFSDRREPPREPQRKVDPIAELERLPREGK